jgi:hypothetical protein
MSSKKVFYIMVAVLVLISLGSVATLVFGESTLREQGAKLVDLKLESQLLDEQQNAIKKANQDIEKYSNLEQIAKSIVPQDKDQAKAVREIVAIAAKAGMSIQNISFDNSNLGVAGTTPTAAQTAPLQISQAKPVAGLPGVYAVGMTIEPVGGSTASYYNFLSLLEGLENNRRTAQVTTVSVQPRTSRGTVIGYDYKLTLNIYIKPGATQ